MLARKVNRGGPDQTASSERHGLQAPSVPNFRSSTVLMFELVQK